MGRCSRAKKLPDRPVERLRLYIERAAGGVARLVMGKKGGKDQRDSKLVDVYSAQGEAEANVIKGLLESNGIPCILRSDAATSVHAFTVDGMGQVKVSVLDSLADRAREIIST